MVAYRGQADAFGLSHGSELGLLVVIEHHGVCQLQLKLFKGLLGLLELKLEVVDSLRGSLKGFEELLGLAIDPLSGQAQFLGMPRDVTIASEMNLVSASNLLCGSYHVRG